MLPFIREISDPPPQYFMNPRDPQTNKNTHYHHFDWHCGVFYGLKWRIWLAKMYFSVCWRFLTALAKEIFFRLFRCHFFFFSFIFEIPFKVIIEIQFMFLGINIFWAPLRAHLNPYITARAKMSLSWAQNIFMLTLCVCIAKYLSSQTKTK